MSTNSFLLESTPGYFRFATILMASFQKEQVTNNVPA